MKLFRRLSALVMTLMLVLSLSIGVLAADFDNMADGFAYDGEDTEVNINLKSDDYGYYEAKEGKTYNISSDNGSELFQSSFTGSGTVEVNVNSSNLFVGDSVTAAINGNVDNQLSVYGQAEVVVTGDVNYAYTSDQSTLTINGDVVGNATARGQSEVTVNGDSTCGVSVIDYAKVVVNGDTGSVYANGQVEVIINGNVSGADGDSNVDYSDPFAGTLGTNAMSVNQGATVTVTGDVSGGDAYGLNGRAGYALYAHNSTVTIGGDVNGGDLIADPNTKQPYDFPLGASGFGINISGSSTVTVGGNVTGGSSSSDSGVAANGANVYGNSNTSPATLIVAGTVTGGTSEHGTDGIGINVIMWEGYENPSVTVYDYDTAYGDLYYDDRGEMRVERPLTQEELDEIITTTKDKTPPANDGNEGGSSPATRAPDYGTSFYYSRGRLINEHGVSVRALFAFGNNWEETVENGIVTITSAEQKGEIVVTVESLKIMMDVGIETILFNGTKLVLKDAVAERSAYDTYTITASAILLNGAAV